MKKNLLISVLLAIVVFFGFTATAFAYDEYTDISGHWAEDAIIEWSDRGVLLGFNGKFRPEDGITRGEMAAIIDRVIKYTDKSANTFPDLDDSDWYTDSILKANAAGVILGDTIGMRPKDTIIRQEAIAMIARAFGFEGQAYDIAVFSDINNISDWAIPAVSVMQNKGLIDWCGDTFQPKKAITRAEVVATLDNIVNQIWESNGLFCDYIDGSAVINSSKIYLHNSYIDGNLIIGGDAQRVVVDNCIITGEIINAGNANLSILDVDSPAVSTFYYGNSDISVISGVAENTFSAYYFDQENGRTVYTDPDVTTRAGIDVSEWQNNIDWAQVADDGIDFAIIRLGYRGYTAGTVNLDATFYDNIEGALDNGLDVGVYFFSQAITVEEAIEEAQMCIKYLQEYDINYPVVFDWETVNSSEARTNNMNGTLLTDCAIAFCETIEAAGYTPMVYANKQLSLFTLELGRLTEYPFWFAGYTTYPEFYYGFDMWQYTSDGSVDGIDGRVDMNIEFIN